MMSRKNYRAFARMIKSGLEGWPQWSLPIAMVARDLAVECKQDNPNFRYDKFFDACGLDGFGYPVGSEHSGLSARR